MKISVTFSFKEEIIQAAVKYEFIAADLYPSASHEKQETNLTN